MSTPPVPEGRRARRAAREAARGFAAPAAFSAAPTAVAPDPDTPPGPDSSTPTVRAALRRTAFWIIVVLGGLLVIAATLSLTRPDASRGTRLGAEDSSPGGSRAVVQVLRDRGVDVQIATDYDAARELLARGGSTLLLADENRYLNAERVERLLGEADRSVLVEPGFLVLDALFPDVTMAGTLGEQTASACTRATSISGGNAYRGTPADTGCFGDPDTGYLLLTPAGGRTALLGASAILQNESIADHENAAFALGLLGSTPRLVWYQPTTADLEVTGGAGVSAAEATPAWLTSVLGLILLTALGAMAWRGRRFGALVAEDLPVIVPAAETMRGRARLYQSLGARERALDALRIGTIDRIASALGLPRHATVTEVSAAAADRLGRPRAEIHAILFDTLPRGERDLMAGSAALSALEAAINASVQIAPAPPTTPPSIGS